MIKKRELSLKITESSFCCADYTNKIAEDTFKIKPGEPAFHAKGGLKDATHILELGKQSGVKLPLAEIT